MNPTYLRQLRDRLEAKRVAYELAAGTEPPVPIIQLLEAVIELCDQVQQTEAWISLHESVAIGAGKP